MIKEFLVANNVQALRCLLSSTYAHALFETFAFQESTISLVSLVDYLHSTVVDAIPTSFEGVSPIANQAP